MNCQDSSRILDLNLITQPNAINLLKRELVNKLNKIIVSLKVVFEVKVVFVQF